MAKVTYWHGAVEIPKVTEQRVSLIRKVGGCRVAGRSMPRTSTIEPSREEEFGDRTEELRTCLG